MKIRATVVKTVNIFKIKFKHFEKKNHYREKKILIFLKLKQNLFEKRVSIYIFI